MRNPKILQLKDQVFGRLTVISQVENDSCSKSRWLCRCECGIEKVIRGSVMVRKKDPVKSCGCLRREITRIRSTGPSSPTYRHGKAKTEFNRQMLGASHRDLVWSLSFGQFTDLISGRCVYCDASPVSDSKGLVRNGIDRFDNDIGYVSDNCVSCCWPCNDFKGRLSGREFLNRCFAIVDYQKSIRKRA